MASAPLLQPRISLKTFRTFVEDRPDNEHWELIDGVAMMMAPPTVAHQVISRNLHLLLHGALAQHAPDLIALARIGLNLGPAVEDYDPEPDVVVIDAETGEKVGDALCRSISIWWLKLCSGRATVQSLKISVRSTSCMRPANAS